jgi:hypothetical protein
MESCFIKDRSPYGREIMGATLRVSAWLAGTTTEGDWARVRSSSLLLAPISVLTGRGAISLSSLGGEGQGEEAVVLSQHAR